MVEVLRSLSEIATSYWRFEKDQVLTHDHLNQVVSYLDDQSRLSRVGLLGVGVLCGLRAVQGRDSVTLTRGIGITTDGDVVHYPNEVSFDRFKSYPDDAPSYGPFQSGGARIPLFELIPAGVADDAARSLGDFGAAGVGELADMAAALYVESYAQDQDLCSGTDCDNLGLKCINRPKLLLLERRHADLLATDIPTADRAARALPEVAADRPIVDPSLDTFAKLAAAYKTACDAIRAKLAEALPKLLESAGPFLDDVITADTAGKLISALEQQGNGLDRLVAARGRGPIQYYYDFLRDLVASYTELREQLFDNVTLCCPSVDAFPKHLLLGRLGTAEAASGRTAFYPSALAGDGRQRLRHARFLAGKLIALVDGFALPEGEQEIRITPSLAEESSLEDRAIPFYYRINDDNPIYRQWNFTLHQRDQDTSNYYYHFHGSDLVDGGKAARNPLAVQIGCFPFFRIEGHWGRSVTSAVDTLRDLIRRNNLPIEVQAVLLGSERARIAVKPPIRYTDLHRLHYLVRQEIGQGLSDAVAFSGNFKSMVDAAVDSKVIGTAPEMGDGPALRDLAAKNDARVQAQSAVVKAQLDQPYSVFKADASWKIRLKDAISAAGDFKTELGNVTRTELVTPFDTIIGNNHLPWLDWLDDEIGRKDEEADAKLMLPEFLTRHPGTEHWAGVMRGGTFVLVYDRDQIVVADFMLPYQLPEEAEAEPAQPPLPKPDIVPDKLILDGIKVIPSREKYIADKLQLFENKIEPKWQEKLDVSKSYADIFRNTASIMVNAINNPKLREPALTLPSDSFLDLQKQQLDLQRLKVEKIEELVKRPDLSEQERTDATELNKRAQEELAQTVTDTVNLMAAQNTDVTPGSAGHEVMLSAAVTAAKVTDTDARTALDTRLQNVVEQARPVQINPGLLSAVGVMRTRR